MSKKLIIVEGPDGVGKSTITEKLFNYFSKIENPSVTTRKIVQPNSLGALGFLRQIVKTDRDLGPFERQLLHTCSHIQDLHTEFDAEISIMDRSIISAFVYSEANPEFPVEKLDLLKRVNSEPHIEYFIENNIEVYIFLITNEKSFRDIESENDAYSNLKFDKLRSLYLKHTPVIHTDFVERGVKCSYFEVENNTIEDTINYIINNIGA